MSLWRGCNIIGLSLFCYVSNFITQLVNNIMIGFIVVSGGEVPLLIIAPICTIRLRPRLAIV